MKLVKADQMQSIDREAIEGYKIPSDELMEKAGRAVSELIIDQLIGDMADCHVAIFCGKGNNGGDGLVVARFLHQEGLSVSVYYLGPSDKLSIDSRSNLNRAKKAGVDLNEIDSPDGLPDQLECDLAVDAIFGTGFSGAPQGLTADLINYMNDLDAEILSIDLPSGINADDGSFEGAVVCADYTCTLAQPKYGLFVSPGRELAGEIEVLPIGIPDQVVDEFECDATLLTSEWVEESLPYRQADSHKGEFGKLLLLAGSTGLTGAAALAAKSALRSGCGSAKVGCPKTVQPVLASLLTDATTLPLPDVGRKGSLALRSLGEIRKLAELHDAVVIGPGLGLHHETMELVRRFCSSLDKPMIIDADGLTAFASHVDLFRSFKVKPIITPHGGEFKRLFGSIPPDSIHERIELARRTAIEHQVVLVMKGSPTLVVSPEGDCYLNPTGNNGMATGGSGDVLSGLIGSFLAQGMEAFDAALISVFLHGTAGDYAAVLLSQRAMTASDMVEALPYVFVSFD